MWNIILLTLIWATELPVLIYAAFAGLIETAFGLVRGHFSLHQTWLIFIFYEAIQFLSLVLILAEIFKYRLRTLRPRFFTLSQSSRAVLFSYLLLDQFRRSRLADGYFNEALFTKNCVLAIGGCGGAVYGLYVWRRYRKYGDALFLGPSDEHELNRQMMLTSTINRAYQINAKCHRVSSVVYWIHCPLQTSVSAFQNDVFNDLFAAIKWIPGSIALIPLITFAPRFGSEPRQDQTTKQSTFDDWNYLKPHIEEDDQTHPASHTSHLVLDSLFHDVANRARTDSGTRYGGMPERLLGPRYLCFLDASEPRGYMTMKAADRRSRSDFIFISYTRRQFYTQIIGDPTLPVELNQELKQTADADTTTLADYAVHAAKAAGVEAFWIDFECVQPEDDERAEDSMEDVYRICDIVRAAHSLVIVTGPPVRPDGKRDVDTEAEVNRAEWLHEWGKRLWTVPEALLCSAEHRIAVYAVGIDEPQMVARRNLASLVWDDAGALRQLVDHYESSIHLTQLELISIALECLQRRQTEKRMSGDVAYALSGLLRQRPKVNKRDSGFQAFARLSLANDSDMLLERLICLRSFAADSPWYDMCDVWNARLWDIHPLCQISDIIDEDTIILGGAQGAVVNWSYLHPVDYAVGTSRRYSWIFARHFPTLCIVLVAFCVGGALIFNLFWYHAVPDATRRAEISQAFFYGESVVIGVVLVVSLISSLFAPMVLQRLFSQKIADTSARFFGIEGLPELEEVERVILGRDKGRIRWCSNLDPDRRLQHPEQSTVGACENGGRVYTLIDTLTLTAVAFTAKRHPNIVMACGREHGYVRAILCSYSSESNTLSKESTLRMKMSVLERMPKMERVRFRLTSEEQFNDADGPE